MMQLKRLAGKMRIQKWRIGNMKLHVKFLLIIVMVCLCLLIGNYWATQSTYRVYDEQIYRMMVQTLASYVGQVENEFSKIETLTLSMIGDAGIQNNLMRLNNPKSKYLEKVQARANLKSQLANYMMGTNAFECFAIVVASDGFRVLWDPGSGRQITAPMAAYAYENGMIRYVADADSLLMCRRIRQTQNMSLSALATMVGIVDIRALVNKCSWVYTNVGVDHLDISIFYDEEHCLYRGNTAHALLEENGYAIQNGSFVVQTSSTMGWYFVLSTPYEAILSSTRQSIMRSVMITIAIAIGAVLLSVLFVRMITRHLDKLLNKFDTYANGQLPSAAESLPYQDRHDEIGRLHRHFDHMAFENRKLSEENYNRMLLFKETEYRQLQQQIQPHFIFNALSTIMWMAHRNGDEETADLTVSLAKLLRASMSMDGDLNTVQNEVKIVQAYMNIQRVRYRERLQFEVQIPPELQDVLLPRMTLQPLVENAIHYAAEEMLETCVIRIYGRAEGKKALLIVEDNGMGMEEDMLNKLQTGEVKPRGTGIGLRNIHQRIQLAFSQEDGLTIHSRSGQNQICISVPLQPEKTGA